MAYRFYSKKTFVIEDSNKSITIDCYTQNTTYGFRHVAVRYGFSELSKPIAKRCYYNRTWERYQYESVLKDVIKKLGLNTSSTITGSN